MKPKLYKLLFKQSIKETFEYKTTFFLVITFGLFFSLIEIISSFIFFKNTDLIFGWSKNEFILLVLTYSLIQYAFQFLFVSSHDSLSGKIVGGELDYSLLRPVNNYLFNIFYRIDLPSLINFLIVFSGVIYFLIILKLSLLTILIYAVFICLGVWFYFLMSQIMVTITFWAEGFDLLLGVPEYLIDFGNKPKAIYPQILQIILTFVIPVVTAVNAPVDIIRGYFDYYSFIYYIVILIILTIFSIFLWKKGLAKYSSAS